jgi:hypothetical protein
MSMPRRAMKEMGFQACCLRCDAVDIAASVRCKRCISRHTSIRDQIAAVSHDDPFTQFAKEMLMMAAAPHRYDHDEVHRAVLVEQQHLAAGLSEPVQKSTIEDIEELFEQQKNRQKANVIQDIANQNEWRDAAPSKEEQKEMIEMFEEKDNSKYGARTIPSRVITQVDRSERSGEDLALTDRLQAAANVKEVPVEEKEQAEEVNFEELQEQRKEWKSVVSEVDDLLKDAGNDED